MNGERDVGHLKLQERNGLTKGGIGELEAGEGGRLKIRRQMTKLKLRGDVQPNLKRESPLKLQKGDHSWKGGESLLGLID